MSNKLIKALVAFSVLTSNLVAAPAKATKPAAKPSVDTRNYNPSNASNQDFGIYIGGQSGYSTDKGGVVKPDVFIPIRTGKTGVTFIDLRGHFGTTSNTAVNVTAGYRKAFSKNVVVGFNGTMDYNRSAEQSNIFLLGAGAEVFTKNNDFRVNFFLPVDSEIHHTDGAIPPYAFLENNQFKMFIAGNFEKVYSGISADYGRRFTFGKGYQLRVGLSLSDYYFAGYNNVISYNLNARLSKEFKMSETSSARVYIEGGYSASYNMTKNEGKRAEDYYVQAGVQMRFGIGSNSLERPVDEFLLTNEVRREQNAVIDYKTDPYQGVFDGTVRMDGYDYSKAYEYSANDNVVAKIQSADKNSIVMLNGKNGDINVATAINLKEGQVLLGSQRSLVVRGPNGVTAILILGGPTATVNGTNVNQDVIVTNNYNRVEGLNINGGRNGIVVGGDNNKLVNLRISNSSDNGIYGNNVYNLDISRVDINNVWNSGIELRNSSNIDIRNSTINSAYDGIKIVDSSNVAITTVDVTNVVNNGVYLNGVTNFDIHDLYVNGAKNAVVLNHYENGNITDLRAYNIDNSVVVASNSENVCKSYRIYEGEQLGCSGIGCDAYKVYDGEKLGCTDIGCQQYSVPRGYDLSCNSLKCETYWTGVNYTTVNGCTQDSCDDYQVEDGYVLGCTLDSCKEYKVNQGYQLMCNDSSCHTEWTANAYQTGCPYF